MPNKRTGTDKVHLKRDCFNGSIVNCIRESILHSFGHSSPRGHNSDKQPGIKFFKKTRKSAFKGSKTWFDLKMKLKICYFHWLEAVEWL